MGNIFKHLIDHFHSSEDRWVAFWSGLWGLMGGIQFTTIWTGWVAILKAVLWIASSAITVMIGLLVKDFYTYKLKNKIFKNAKEKIDDKAA